MLQLLHIENIAVIEEADITFDGGFNALTGETGAGKSIVIDAMGAVLGQRTSRDLIRTGANKAFVSAVFTGVPPLAALSECGLAPEEGELLLQREIYADGKNACRISGRPVTVAQLRRIGNSLLNIHGQHDGQQLLDEEQHGAYLDSYGRVEGYLETYAACFEAMEATRRKLKSLQMDEAEKERRLDSLNFQIDELERAELKPGEEEALLQRRNLLRNSEKFMSAIQGALWNLSGGDEGGGAVSALQEAGGALAGARGLDGQFAQLQERLEGLYSEAYDVAETLRDLEESFEFSPRELDDLESRADLLYRLKKKYGPTVEDMLEYLEQCRKELDQITFAADTAARLEKELEKERKQVIKAAGLLSGARKAAAKELELRIQDELRQLDMPRVRFAICFGEKEPDASGVDVVRFLMSANVGEELRPINKVASGGELARIMLALKNVLAENETIGTLVFDEVDTGVSGRAAQKVAAKLAQVSRRKQVLCVTHLPQLAAMADTHFSVEKGERDGRTFTRVLRLDREQRKRELARLTGGEHLTAAMLAGAEELLDEAEAYRKGI
ncbi:MAG: DNA repair protein RecN [Oscillospiraceae bacterium]|jgi:DNA repair protein RecN (Recombination protein N)|nr:DNA repair protein RecN [Oscillospiraceae bacterium]